MQDPLITIIIVTYNSEDEIIGCLDSIFKNIVDSIVYVVDNASTDNTKELLNEYARNESRVRLILNNDNKGLAAANNQPLPFINSKYALILNPDILLKEDSLSTMVHAMESDSSIGMLGPLCLFEDGEPHVSAHTHYNFFTIVFWRMVPHTIMRYFSDNFSNFKEREVLFVSGACYLIPSVVFKELNGYDPELFLTVSDVADIGVRLRKKGYKALYYPKAVITHFSGRSNAPLKYLTQYWGLTGDLYFVRKHMGTFMFFITKILFVLGSAIRGGMFSIAAAITQKEQFKEKVKMYFKLAGSITSFKPVVKKRE